MSRDTYRFAVVDGGDVVTRILGHYTPGTREVDEIVRRESCLPARVVCLDESSDEPVLVGDRVTVDEDGVAKLAAEAAS